MALTPEQEAQLLADNAKMKETLASLAPLAQEVPTLKAELAKRDEKIGALENGHSAIQNDLQSSKALTALKSVYPDVPEATLSAALALPEESRKAMLEPVQRSATELKAKLAKTDPMSGWADAGSIQPATDAEREATKAEKRKAYEEHAKTGNVFGMLDQRATEIAAHVRRSLSPR